MRCKTHCPPARAGGLLGAVAVVAAGAVAYKAIGAAAPVVSVVVPVVTVVILVACAAGSVVVWRLVRTGTPRPARAVVPARAVARAAITAPPRALEAAPRPGVTVTLTASDYVKEPR